LILKHDSVRGAHGAATRLPPVARAAARSSRCLFLHWLCVQRRLPGPARGQPELHSYMQTKALNVSERCGLQQEGVESGLKCKR
jgi:hypothetical protein